MTTRTWKVYGEEGHRQAMSFMPSEIYDFSTSEEPRIIEIENYDKTRTHDCSIVRITADTAEACVRELDGQLSDGFFENTRYGHVEEII